MTQADESPLSILDKSRAALRNGSLDEDIARSTGERSARFRSEDRWAAVIVTARGGSQQSWSRREELSIPLYEKLRTLRGPPIEQSLEAEFRELDTDDEIKFTVCSNCRIRPGFGPCPSCSGVGVQLVQGPGADTSAVVDCPDCQDGFATCTVCGGTTKTVAASVHYVTRKPFRGRQLVMPDAILEVATILDAAYAANDEIPSSLAIDVEAQEAGTAYRGVQPGSGADFHGYRLGQAPQQARAFLQRVRSAPNFIVRELRAFALPFLMATYDTPTGVARIVMFVDVTGTARFQRL